MTQDGVVKKIRFYSWYDSNKTWIGGNDTADFNMVAPANAAYLTITLQGGSVLNTNTFYIHATQVVDGTTKKLTSPDASLISLIIKE